MSTFAISPETEPEGDFTPRQTPNLAWHKSVPPRITEADPYSSSSDGWRAWRKFLARRRPTKLQKRLTSGKFPPLLWGAGDENDDMSGSRQLIAALHAWRRGKPARHPWSELAEQWLSCSAVPADTPWAVAETLAWAHAIAQLPEVLPAELWWPMTQRLIDIAGEAATLDAAAAVDPTARLLLAGELPLVLSAELPELSACRLLAATGHGVIEKCLCRLAGESSGLSTHDWPRLRAWLACWTRSWIAGRTIDKDLWSTDARRAADELLQWALRLTRRDGSAVLADRPTAADLPWLRVALETIGSPTARRMAVRVAPKLAASDEALTGNRLPPPGVESEVGMFGLLRTDWSAKAATLTVDYASPKVQSEFAIGRDLVWSGASNLTVSFNGGTLAMPRPWEQVCWHSDDDVDYLEIETELAGGARLQRQMLLCRSDEFLLLADVVLGTETGDWQIDASWNLADGARYLSNNDTTEGLITARGAGLVTLPLALPEWRAETQTGRLQAEGGVLTAAVSARGQRGVMLATWFDFNRRRRKRPYTWRRLTVADERQVVGGDVAAGFRVQFGNQHWLIYRSLGEIGCRTLLGHNLISEFLVARFLPNGTVDPLLEIEPPDA